EDNQSQNSHVIVVQRRALASLALVYFQRLTQCRKDPVLMFRSVETSFPDQLRISVLRPARIRAVPRVSSICRKSRSTYSPVMSILAHRNCIDNKPLSGVKRTRASALHMSAFDPKRTSPP